MNDRVYKFRAWDTADKKMILWDALCNEDKFGEGCGEHLADYLNNQFSNIKPLMQFTGLTDKNGKEIFEGDIIKVKEINWLVEPINSLERDGENYGLCVSPNGDGKNYFIDKSILAGEIIGNIYENPNLLK